LGAGTDRSGQEGDISKPILAASAVLAAALGLALALALGFAGAAQAEPMPAAQPGAATTVNLTPAQLFAFADKARDAGDLVTAEQAYRALAANPDIELRSEARFRLGLMLADRAHKYREAAAEFRRILDEKPGAARVRLELARMHAMLGNVGAAEREFRAAEAAGLPPEVERMVRFYAGALSARKAFGGSLEVSLAPDSNINRATRSDTLSTVIGDFELNEDAKAKSSVGLALRGQAYHRLRLQEGIILLSRVSASADLYRERDYDDVALSVQSGPEYASGADRITFAFGPGWRWYGMKPYSASIGGSAAWQHPMGRRTQLRVEGAIASVNNRRNDLQDGETYSLSASLDRAFSARAGGGVQVHGFRDDARDPGYATTSGGVSLYAFRELGRTTAVATVGYSHLEADERLFLYPRRRVEDRFTASIAGTFRALRIGSFAPLIRLRWERNRSTIEIYDYKRLSAEFGVASAF
jgi:outer membrane protein